MSNSGPAASSLSVWDRLAPFVTVVSGIATVLFLVFNWTIATFALLFSTFIAGWFWIYPRLLVRSKVLSLLVPLALIVSALVAGIVVGRRIPIPFMGDGSVYRDDTNQLLQEMHSWNLLIAENFRGNNWQWFVGEGASDLNKFHLYIEKRYRIEVDTFTQGFAAEVWSEVIDTGNRYYVEVDAQKIKGDENAGYGIMLNYNRSDNSSFYVFQIRNNQTVAFSVHDRGKEIAIMNASANMIIPGEINKLGVLVNGDTYRLYINNQYITEVEDPRVKGGKIGMWAGFPSNDQGVIEFDNLKIYVPPS